MLRLAPRLHLAAMPLRSRLASPHVAQLASKVRISALARPRPISPFPPLPRRFSTSPLLRNTQLPLSSNSFPPPPPPKPSIIRRLVLPLRHLKYLRYLPYKTLLFVGVVLFTAEVIDDYFKDNVQAIRTQFTVPENTWLYLNLNDLHIVDSPHSERGLQVVPFVSSAGKRRMTMLELTNSIQEAAMDPKVQGMVLSFNDSIVEHRAVLTGEVIESSLGYGKLEELQTAIAKFARAKQGQHKLSQMKLELVDEIQKKYGPTFLDKWNKGEATLEPDFLDKAMPNLLSDDTKPVDPNREVLFDLSNECVIAISDNYSAQNYGLANVAHKIYMQPSGEISLMGLSMSQYFFGKFLEKWGVDYKVEARRDYKSAMAAFTDTTWNAKTRENLEDLVWSLQAKTFMDLYIRQARKDKVGPFNDRDAYMLAAVTQLTGKQQKDIRPQTEPYIKTINTGPLRAEEAYDAGLIDGYMYHHELLDTLAQNGVKTWSVRKYLDAYIANAIFGDFNMDEWIIPQVFRLGKKPREDDEVWAEKKDVVLRGMPKKVSLDVTLNVPRKDKTDGQPSTGGPLDGAVLKVDVVVPRTIGLVYLDNAIEGKGRFGGEAMSAYLMKAAKDPSIHAIVFRINSPGGDAVASDTIYQAVQFARRYKPVVASFSDVAASGGYYAAASADMIISNNYTITGSIGVIMGYPVIKRLLEKIDISTDAIEFIPNAAWHHPELGNMPAAELEKLSRHVDATYDRFKTIVAEGRNMSVEDVEKVAQGQVFTGSQAEKLGLVDRTGTLEDALLVAAFFSLQRLQKLASQPGKAGATVLEINEREKSLVESILQGSAIPPADMQLVRDRIKELAQGVREPTDEEIEKLIEGAQYEARPVVSVTTIPHVNPANEALGYAISSAFASDEERSPVPIDLPLPEPENDDDVPRSRIVLGALLGLARTNEIPLWQFPLFCYWYAGQAAGRMGEGVIGNGLLDRMFAGVFGGREVDLAVRRVARGRPPLFNDTRGLGMDIRMEMMPLQLYF